MKTNEETAAPGPGRPGRPRTAWRIAALALVASAAAGATTTPGSPVSFARPLAAQEPAPPALAERIRLRIEPGDAETPVVVAGAELRAAAELRRFYETRGFRPAWSEDGRPSAAADSLVRAVALSTREGLRPDDYHLQPIRSALLDTRRAARNGTPVDPRRLAELDLLLTDAFLLYGSHLANGRIDPTIVHPEWSAARTEGDLVGLLQAALATGRIGWFLGTLLPEDPGYAKLRASLEAYRQVQDVGGWPVVPGRTLRPGQRDPAVQLLRERLRLSGDLVEASAPADSALYDFALTDAVSRFQRRHGVEGDGVTGLATSALLNVPVETRIRQIELNLERWRWLPRDLGRRHVVVNIAGFQVYLVDGDSILFSGRAMVGQQYRETPVFSDELTYLVLNPTWTIPPNILEVDKLPLIRRNPDYLKEHRIRVLAPTGGEVDPASVDWATMTGNTRYRLRMDPGPANPLGRVKFMFPNPYFIYLHDTPDRELFDRTDRAFSSGCIRIERPLELASTLLGEGWDQARIEAALRNPREQTLPLREPVPVHLLYLTTWVDQEGALQFRRDIYGRDAALEAALRLPAVDAD